MAWRTAFFVINALMAVALAVGGVVVSMSGDPSRFALAGAFALVWPALGFAALEALLYFGNNEDLEWPLGLLCGVLGGFALFMSLFFAPALRNGLHVETFAVLGGLLGMGGYGLWCCWWRTRRHHRARSPRGFPVLPTPASTAKAVQRVDGIDPT